MKIITFFAILIFFCCSSLDKSKVYPVNVKIEDFSLEKLTYCFSRYDSIILKPTTSPYKLGMIIFENNSTNSIWVFAETKFNTLFYQSPRVADYNEKDEIIVQRLANVFSNCKIEILPNSSKCFLTYFLSSKVGKYQEFQINYFTDTINIDIFIKNIRK